MLDLALSQHVHSSLAITKVHTYSLCSVLRIAGAGPDHLPHVPHCHLVTMCNQRPYTVSLLVPSCQPLRRLLSVDLKMPLLLLKLLLKCPGKISVPPLLLLPRVSFLTFCFLLVFLRPPCNNIDSHKYPVRNNRCSCICVSFNFAVSKILRDRSGAEVMLPTNGFTFYTKSGKLRLHILPTLEHDTKLGSIPEGRLCVDVKFGVSDAR